MTWWPIVVLCGLVAGALLYPWVSRHKKSSAISADDQQTVNVALYKESLSDLDWQKQAGEISEQEYEGSLEDLKRRLLDDNSTTQGRSHNAENSVESNQPQAYTFPVLVLAVVLVCGMAWWLYGQQGASGKLEIAELSQAFYAEQLSASQEQREPDLKSGERLIQVVQQELRKTPEDWGLKYLLASTYGQMGNYDAALPLYKEYLLVNPTHERVLTEYVQFLYIAAEGQLTERVQFVSERALMLNPHNEQVLGLLAMHHYREGDFPQAISYWQQMLAITPPGSEGYGLISGAIEQAKKQQQQATSGEVSGEPGGETVDKPVDDFTLQK